MSGTINERIKAVVAASGKTKTAFAREINISQPYLSQMCAVGGKVPSNRTVADICREFGVSKTWLKTGEGEMYARESVGELGSMNGRIKIVRQGSGMTQLQFAERLSLSRNYVAQMETGKRTPSDRTISDICREFGVSKTWLSTGEDEMCAHEPAGKLGSVNERIKQVRRATGLTQAELAKNLGLKQNTIATYEMGRQVPSDRTISDICRIFNVSELWLRTGEGEMYVKRSRNEEIAMLINELMREEDESFRKRFTAAMLELPPELWPELEKFFQKLGG